MNRPDRNDGEPDSVMQKTRVALERLSADAKRLRGITELQSLKANPIYLSCDTLELLAATRTHQAESDHFATLEEMMNLLRLMALRSDPESAPAPREDKASA